MEYFILNTGFFIDNFQPLKHIGAVQMCADWCAKNKSFIILDKARWKERFLLSGFVFEKNFTCAHWKGNSSCGGFCFGIGRLAFEDTRLRILNIAVCFVDFNKVLLKVYIPPSKCKKLTLAGAGI